MVNTLPSSYPESRISGQTGRKGIHYGRLANAGLTRHEHHLPDPMPRLLKPAV
jgi:hypothetical protein